MEYIRCYLFIDITASFKRITGYPGVDDHRNGDDTEPQTNFGGYFKSHDNN